MQVHDFIDKPWSPRQESNLYLKFGRSLALSAHSCHRTVKIITHQFPPVHSGPMIQQSGAS